MCSGDFHANTRDGCAGNRGSVPLVSCWNGLTLSMWLYKRTEKMSDGMVGNLWASLPCCAFFLPKHGFLSLAALYTPCVVVVLMFLLLSKIFEYVSCPPPPPPRASTNASYLLNAFFLSGGHCINENIRNVRAYMYEHVPDLYGLQIVLCARSYTFPFWQPIFQIFVTICEPS